MTRFQSPAFLKAALIFILCAALLCGCAGSGETQPETTTEPPVRSYTVRFMMGGIICSEQEVVEGSYPQVGVPEVPGLKFVQWLDGNDRPVDPAAVSVSADVTYTAQAYPQLSEQVRFLAVSEDGYLRPDEPLTADELYTALSGLAAEGAEKYFPGMPLGNQKLEKAMVSSILNHFFGETAVADAFAALPAEEAKEESDSTQETTGETVPVQEGKDYLLRGQFASVMCRLMNWDLTAPVTVAEGVKQPMDVSVGREDYAALMKSSIDHEENANGTVWTELILPTNYAPGFVNIDGWLYYVQEDGYFLRDGKQGDLTFSADGRYTSGDAELDALVADILDDIVRENPNAERLELLRKAYEHCRDAYTYLRKSSYAKGATGWEIKDAKVMFTSLRGNCYNYAAAFWAVARGLGYEARAVSGTVTQTIQPHGWVLIEFDGQDYIFDCEWEMAYRVKQNRYDMDMFMLTLKEGKYWNYDH